MKKKLAIIGANGLLGTDLVKYLQQESLVLEITKQNYNSYKGSTFDVLINANGNSKRFWANQNVLEDYINTRKL